MFVCVRGSVHKCVQYVYPLVPALPSWPRVAPAAVPCAGLHSWGEPWGRAAAWCTSSYPLILLFPLAGPLSLTAHAITQWHSFIYCCTLAPPSPSTTTTDHSACTNATTDSSVLRVCSHLPWQTILHSSHCQNPIYTWQKCTLRMERRCKCHVMTVMTCLHTV